MGLDQSDQQMTMLLKFSIKQWINAENYQFAYIKNILQCLYYKVSELTSYKLFDMLSIIFRFLYFNNGIIEVMLLGIS